jgi:hypothetical protein
MPNLARKDSEKRRRYARLPGIGFTGDCAFARVESWLILECVRRSQPERPLSPISVREAIPPSQLAEELHKPFFLMFLVVWLALALGEWFSVETFHAWRIGGQLLLLTAAACAVVGLGRRLPPQTVVGACLSIATLAVIIEFVARATGFPFGAGSYSADYPEREFRRVPWQLVVGWSTVLVLARGHARSALVNWGGKRLYGLWVIVAAAVLAALLDLVWLGIELPGDTFGLRPSYQGRSPVWILFPLILIKSFAAFFVLLATSPWFIRKQPSQYQEEFYTTIIWLLLVIYLLLAHRPGVSWIPSVLLAGLSVGFWIPVLACHKSD